MLRPAAAAALAAACAACAGSRGESRLPAPPPNILLITIDTWRADRLRPDLTPNLSALARSGVLFGDARSAVPLTLPSHTTMLTGLLPPSHGVRENGVPLADSHPTVATLLRAQGYRTAAFVGAFVLDRRFGLAQGFDVYDDRIPRDPNATERLDAERPASAVVDAALGWFDSEHQTPTPAPGASTSTSTSTGASSSTGTGTSTKHQAPSTRHPWFVWIHVYDPHAPYVSREGRATSTGQRYDAEVSSVDTELARVLNRVPRDQTVVVVAGDHGEGLGEHGEQTHGMLLYDSTLRVPLFIAGAGVKPDTRTDPVSLVDLAPTVLQIAGVARPFEMAGVNLLGGKGGSDIYAETEYPRVAGWSRLQALTDGRWKAIRAGRDTELYDLANDPAEAHSVAAAQASTATAMAARIDAVHTRTGSQETPAVSAEAQERLRALGYVASSAQPSTIDGAPNPSANIAAWNAFEEALTALNFRSAGSAVAALDQLARRHPDAPVFQTTYARAVKESGRTADALALYRAAAKRWPTDAALLHDLAVAARDAGQLDESLKADRAALALEPSSAVAHNGLGLLAIDRGETHDAVREFTRATALDPNNASYWVNLGNARHASGDAVGAEDAYKKGLELAPHSPDAANGIGVLLVEAKRPAEAVPWFERARAGSASFIEAQLNLGIALQQSGEPGRAAEAYRAVLANPGARPREKEAARNLLAALNAAR